MSLSRPGMNVDTGEVMRPPPRAVAQGRAVLNERQARPVERSV